MNQSINIDKNILLRRIHKRPKAYSDNNINNNNNDNNSSAEARYVYNMTHNTTDPNNQLDDLSPKRRNPNKKRPKRHLKRHLKLPKTLPQSDESSDLMDTLATGPIKTKPRQSSANNIINNNTIAITTAAIDEVEEEKGHNYEENQVLVSESKKRKKSLFDGIKGNHSISNKVAPITTTAEQEETELLIMPTALGDNISDDTKQSTALTLPEPTTVTPDEADAGVGGSDVENALVSTEVKAKPLVTIHFPRTHHLAIAPLTSPLKEPSIISPSDQLLHHSVEQHHHQQSEQQHEQHQSVAESIGKESPREYDEAVVVTSHEGLNLSPRSDIAPLLDDPTTGIALEKGQISERSFRSILKKPSSFNYGGTSSPRGLQPERVSSTLSLLDPYLTSAESSRPSTQTSAVRPDSTHSPTRQPFPSLSTKRSLISKVSFHYTVPAPDTNNTTTATSEGGQPLTVPDTVILTGSDDEPKPKNSVHHVRIAQFLESDKMLTLSRDQTGSDTNIDSYTYTNINSYNNSYNNSPTITTHKSLPPPLNPSPYTPPLGDTSAHTLVKSYEDPSKPLNHSDNSVHPSDNNNNNTLLWQSRHPDESLETGLLKNTTQKGHNSDFKANKYLQNNNNNNDDAHYDSDEEEEGSWGNSYDDSSSDDDNEVSLVYTHYITHC